MADALTPFLLPVQRWFRETLGRPTPPQTEGWPAIRRGEHTLILAPTGSGKTLAAFLCGIDQLYRDLASPQPPGVRLLYVSPLKALNNDVERNLRSPLEGIAVAAARANAPLPEVRVAVRTGDTSAAARRQMLRKPPHILITTPESLYLMLTSPLARDIFRTVRSVIVDEIHTLCGEKRGVHLSLSLERLLHLTAAPVQRIGLSATIRPLEEVARFLGGSESAAGSSTSRRCARSRSTSRRTCARRCAGSRSRPSVSACRSTRRPSRSAPATPRAGPARPCCARRPTSSSRRPSRST